MFSLGVGVAVVFKHYLTQDKIKLNNQSLLLQVSQPWYLKIAAIPESIYPHSWTVFVYLVQHYDLITAFYNEKCFACHYNRISSKDHCFLSSRAHFQHREF